MRKKILLGLGGICFAFLVGEAAARVILPLLPDPPDTPFIGDKACMYRLRPSEPGEFPEDHDNHINQFGFRDRNHPRTKPWGRYRVLGLGDSFVYGAVPIQDNFLRVAERKWNDTVGATIDILLMGVPGWSTENQLGYLQSEGLGLDPDLVLVNFFVGNDVTGIPVRSRIIRGNAYPTTSPLPMRNLLRKSQLFVMVESLFLRRVMEKARGGKSAEPAERQRHLSEDHETESTGLSSRTRSTNRRTVGGSRRLPGGSSGRLRGSGCALVAGPDSRGGSGGSGYQIPGSGRVGTGSG